MAITKEKKEELVSQYEAWMGNSKALILTEYVGLSVKDLDDLRHRIREAGGEFHIVKNTLTKLALEASGLRVPEDFLTGSTAIGFAFEDGPALAKAINEFAKTSEVVKIKGGFLGQDAMTSQQVTALADLPPLPVMRAQLLGTLMAPASQLARVLAAPASQLAQVLKAYAEQGGAAETA